MQANITPITELAKDSCDENGFLPALLNYDVSWMNYSLLGSPNYKSDRDHTGTEYIKHLKLLAGSCAAFSQWQMCQM